MTFLGVDARVKKQHYSTFIHVAHLPELCAISSDENVVTIGASVSLSTIESFFSGVLKTSPRKYFFAHIFCWNQCLLAMVGLLVEHYLSLRFLRGAYQKFVTLVINQTGN